MATPLSPMMKSTSTQSRFENFKDHYSTPTTYTLKLKSLAKVWHEHLLAISENSVEEIDFRDLITEAEGNE